MSRSRGKFQRLAKGLTGVPETDPEIDPAGAESRSPANKKVHVAFVSQAGVNELDSLVFVFFAPALWRPMPSPAPVRTDSPIVWGPAFAMVSATERAGNGASTEAAGTGSEIPAQSSSSFLTALSRVVWLVRPLPTGGSR